MDEHEAKHGEKTIALTVYLFTDEIATEKGKIVPKHAWTNGTVALQKQSLRMALNRATRTKL